MLQHRSPRVTMPNEDWYLAVTAKRNRRSTTSDLSRQLSSATGTTVSRQTVYRRLGHIGLYARLVCSLILTGRAPGTRYHQENTIEGHSYGGAGWLIWGGIILGSRTDLHVPECNDDGPHLLGCHLEQHVRLLLGAMGAEFLFMDDNARPHRANIVDERECLQSEYITHMNWPAYSPGLNPIEQWCTNLFRLRPLLWRENFWLPLEINAYKHDVNRRISFILSNKKSSFLSDTY
ncbi:transposable element Tcb1 transposase [Trichonephila clavipes]|nr:transposable element Tcb1 transposase [Trichonephila clavipes]